MAAALFFPVLDAAACWLCARRLPMGLFYAFQSLFQRVLEQSYYRPVKRVPEARYGGLFSGLTE